MITRRASLWVIFFTAVSVCAAIAACGARQPAEATAPDPAAPDEQPTDAGSGGEAREKTAAFRPDLPAIPPFETPRHPIRYDDGTWSVYGLRKNIRQSMDQELEVTAYVVKIYRTPDCPRGASCPPPAMPHLWMGDDPDETSERHLARLVGYAQSHAEMDEAAAEAAAGRDPRAGEAAGMPPLVWDWQQGQRYVVKARFTRSSGTGFAHSEGLLEYMEHRCIDCSD